MGMDLYGIKPSSPSGTYFRNSIFWWPPLWDYSRLVAPALARRVREPYANTGGGLCADDSLLLSSALGVSIESGAAAAYAGVRDWSPPVCATCRSLGFPPADSVGPADSLRACDGCLEVALRDPSSWFRFDEDNVRRFADFLKHCGGFEIW